MSDPSASSSPLTNAPSNTGPSNTSAFKDASSNIDNTRAAALSALAQGGSVGLAAWQAAQAAGNADRQAAVKAQLAGMAGASGTTVAAPAGAQAELGAQLAQPFDQYAATSGALQAAGQQANALRSSAADTYFREAGAAVPVIMAQAEAKLGLARQAAAAAAQAGQVKALTDAYNLADAQARAATAQVAGRSALTGPTSAGDLADAISGLSHGFTDSSVLTSLESRGDSPAQAQAIVTAARGDTPKAPSTSGLGGASPGDLNDTISGLSRGFTDQSAITALEARGYSPAQAQSIVTAARGDIPKAPAGSSSASAGAVRSSSAYPAALTRAQGILTKNPDEVAAINQLTAEGMPSGTAYVVVTDAAARMSSAGQQP